MNQSRFEMDNFKQSNKFKQKLNRNCIFLIFVIKSNEKYRNCHEINALKNDNNINRPFCVVTL